MYLQNAVIMAACEPEDAKKCKEAADEEKPGLFSVRDCWYYLVSLLRKKRICTFTSDRSFTAIIELLKFLKDNYAPFADACCLSGVPKCPTPPGEKPDMQDGLVCVQWHPCDDAPSSSGDGSLVDMFYLLGGLAATGGADGGGGGGGSSGGGDGAVDAVDPRTLPLLRKARLSATTVSGLQREFSQVRLAIEANSRPEIAIEGVDNGDEGSVASAKESAQSKLELRFQIALEAAENAIREAAAGAGPRSGGIKENKRPECSTENVTLLEKMFDVNQGSNEASAEICDWLRETVA